MTLQGIKINRHKINSCEKAEANAFQEKKKTPKT